MPITYNPATADTAKGLIAIIDIGSNTVRMVVYHALTRVPIPLFNEKYMCALGKGLGKTGRLNPAGIELAKRAMERFMLMARRLNVSSLDVLATAAVRDAEDGHDFVKELEAQHRIKVRVISGEEEATYGAQGALASIHAPLGIMADLGGGSLELAAISPGAVGDKATTTLGSLRLIDAHGDNYEAMEKTIHSTLKQIGWLKRLHPPTLYAVGGGFRSIAKIHMKAQRYPVDIVHEYEMSSSAVYSIIRKILTMKPSELASLPGLPDKRASTIVPSALVLKNLLHYTGAHSMMVSMSGIREGFFYGLLTPKQRAQDALIASATDLAALIGRRGSYAKELMGWMDGVFVREPVAFKRLRHALCILSELAWSIDPSFRGEWAFQRIVQSSLKGVDHRERVMLALALYYRYRTSMKKEYPAVAVLSAYEKHWARCVGLCANLAYQLTGGKEGNLEHARLEMRENSPSLWLDQEASPLRTDMVEKRLEGLGKAFTAFSSSER